MSDKTKEELLVENERLRAQFEELDVNRPERVMSDDPKYLAALLHDGTPYERAVHGSSVERWTDQLAQLTAQLNRERASLSAACEASDKRAAALNRDVISDNERLRAELESLEMNGGMQVLSLRDDVTRLEADNDRLRAELAAEQQKPLQFEKRQELLVAERDTYKQLHDAAMVGNELRANEYAALRAEVEASKECCMRRITAGAERDALKAELATLTVTAMCSTGDNERLRARNADLEERVVDLRDSNERLRAEVARTTGGRMRDLLTDAEELCVKRYKQLTELREVVELCDLECADLKCWCFTRAAMNRPACHCANCESWALLSKVKP